MALLAYFSFFHKCVEAGIQKNQAGFIAKSTEDKATQPKLPNAEQRKEKENLKFTSYDNLFSLNRWNLLFLTGAWRSRWREPSMSVFERKFSHLLLPGELKKFFCDLLLFIVFVVFNILHSRSFFQLCIVNPTDNIIESSKLEASLSFRELL